MEMIFPGYLGRMEVCYSREAFVITRTSYYISIVSRVEKYFPVQILKRKGIIVKMKNGVTKRIKSVKHLKKFAFWGVYLLTIIIIY